MENFLHPAFTIAIFLFLHPLITKAQDQAPLSENQALTIVAP